MDIAANAKVKHKIKYFYYEQNALHDDFYLQAIKDVLCLFAVAFRDGHKNKDELENAVLVKIALLPGQSSKMIVEVYYERLDGTTGCSIKTIEIQETDDKLHVRKKVKLMVFNLFCHITGSNPSPWGILRGVRPTKIVHRMLDTQLKPDVIQDILVKDYALAAQKAKLAVAVSLSERTLLSENENQKVSIYIGIPFCPTRCLYCSFPAYPLPAAREKISLFLSAIEHDIEAVVKLITRYGLSIQSVYIGGGTPTSLADHDFHVLLQKVADAFITVDTQEFTVEAGRPDSITKNKIKAMVAAHVSRISINPQTMQQKTLDIIGRRHSVEDVYKAYYGVRQAGIKHINMDVIAGLPGETECDFADSLARIGEMKPDNLTVHTLAVKRGSMLKEIRNDVMLPGDHATANMLFLADTFTHEMGMQPYYLYRQKAMLGNLENVGYSLPGAECIYNIQIISERQTIIGIGPAAGTKAVDTKTWKLKSCYNAKDVTAYMTHLENYLSNRQMLLDMLYFKEG